MNTIIKKLGGGGGGGGGGGERNKTILNYNLYLIYIIYANQLTEKQNNHNSCRITCKRSESARERRMALYKRNHQQQ